MKLEGQQLSYCYRSAGVLPSDRWDPHFWDDKYDGLSELLDRWKARPLGEYLPEKGGITYGQVGERKLNPRGAVRYLQVVNIRDTGVDFWVKPDRIAEGSHNDPERSRVREGDILFTNTGFQGMNRLLGRCVLVVGDCGKLNISQDIDLIRPVGIESAYVVAFIKTGLGQQQVERLKYGVRSLKLSFKQVRQIRIPVVDDTVQAALRQRYMRMARAHGRAMERKETLFRAASVRARQEIGDIANGDTEYQRWERQASSELAALLAALEGFLRGERETFDASGTA